MVAGVPTAVLVGAWFFFSTALIFTNRYILVELKFPYPVLLTTWHLLLATAATRLLRRYTHLLDGVDEVNKKLTWSKWATTVLPIGFLFSGSLVCGNYAYVFLSVAFIQMLKSATPVTVLLTSWAFGTEKPNLGIFLNVLFITFGIALASYGEIRFVMTGFVLQVVALCIESMRLVMIQKLLSGRDIKMDALVGLYYFAPACAAINIITAFMLESEAIDFASLKQVGFGVLLFNGLTSFCLNVSAVVVIKRTSTLVLALCGLLKDIGIVAIATFVYHTGMSNLQGFGYSLSLIGLIKYKTRNEPFWKDPLGTSLEYLQRRSGSAAADYQSPGRAARSAADHEWKPSEDHVIDVPKEDRP
ncbi:hypothetical protein SpCBS45565_g06717 [Spizellomyces sp. 'palustris']|nr:hypothetical protein SpCBS45565_g06717 [Spizellomyces sp. 'palustris']